MTERQDIFITRAEDLHHLLKQLIDTTQHVQSALGGIDGLLDDIQNHAHDLRIDITTRQSR